MPTTDERISLWDTFDQESHIFRLYHLVFKEKYIIEVENKETNEGARIGLWFHGNAVLKEYDGCFCLPPQAVILLERNGFIVPDDMKETIMEDRKLTFSDYKEREINPAENYIRIIYKTWHHNEGEARAVEVRKYHMHKVMTHEEMSEWVRGEIIEPNRPTFSHDCSGQRFISTFDLFQKKPIVAPEQRKQWIVELHWATDV